MFLNVKGESAYFMQVMLLFFKHKEIVVVPKMICVFEGFK